MTVTFALLTKDHTHFVASGIEMHDRSWLQPHVLLGLTPLVTPKPKGFGISTRFACEH